VASLPDKAVQAVNKPVPSEQGKGNTAVAQLSGKEEEKSRRERAGNSKAILPRGNW